MTENQEALLKKLLANHHLSLGSIDGLLAHFSSLSSDEKHEVFVAKAGLFKPTYATAKETLLITDRAQLSPIVDHVAFYLSIDMAKRPSQYSNKKWVGEVVPDFTKAFIEGKVRKKREGTKSLQIKRDYQTKILEWRKEGISWRTIAEAINADSTEVKISHVHLKRIVEKWE